MPTDTPKPQERCPNCELNLVRGACGMCGYSAGGEAMTDTPKELNEERDDTIDILCDGLKRDFGSNLPVPRKIVATICRAYDEAQKPLLARIAELERENHRLVKQHEQDKFWERESRETSIRHAKDLEDLTAENQRLRAAAQLIIKVLLDKKSTASLNGTESDVLKWTGAALEEK